MAGGETDDALQRGVSTCLRGQPVGREDGWRIVSSSGLDREAKHLTGLCTPENCAFSPLLSTEITAVPGTSKSFSAHKYGDVPCGSNSRHSEGERSVALGDDQEGFLEVVTCQTNKEGHKGE